MHRDEIIGNGRGLEDGLICGLDNAIDHSDLSGVTWDGNKEWLEDATVVGADGDDGVTVWINIDHIFILFKLGCLRERCK